MEEDEWVLVSDDLGNGAEPIDVITSENDEQRDDTPCIPTASTKSSTEHPVSMSFVNALNAKAESLPTQTVFSLNRAPYFSNTSSISEPLRDFSKAAVALSHNWWSMAMSEASGIISSISEDLADILPTSETTIINTSANIEHTEKGCQRGLLEGLRTKGGHRFNGQNFKEWFKDVEGVFKEVLNSNPQRLLEGLKNCSTPEIAALIDDLELPTIDWNTLVHYIDGYFAKRESLIKKYAALHHDNNFQ